MPSEKQIFTLKQVAFSIQRIISERYQQNYWVQAEMFKLNYTQKGHCFPELVHKEEGKIVTEMRGTIWNTTYQRISKKFAEVVKEPLHDGLDLLLLVKISFHPIYGLSLEILDIDPTYSLGALQREREETIKRLTSEGLMKRNQQLDFPLLPKRLAIISVETSKGFQDFKSLIEHNAWNYKFVYHLFTAQLNGDAAIPSIIAQLGEIKQLKENFDLVLIIRGGGGEIGLSCYNNYDLTKEIASFPLPVLTGIGHSTNITVSELVAYKHAITPSDLADFLLQTFREFALKLQQFSGSIKNETIKIVKQNKIDLNLQVRHFKYVSTQLLQENKHQIQAEKVRLQSQLKFLYHVHYQRLDSNSIQLKKYGQQYIFKQFTYLFDTQFFLQQELPKIITKQRETLENLQKNIDLIDPINVLKRGYSFVLNRDRTLVNSDNVREGDWIEIINFDSTITGEVKKISKNG